MKLPLGPTIAVAGVMIVAAMGTGAWWWWQQNAENLKEAAKASYVEGQVAAARLDETGCAAAATRRHGDSENQTILGSVRTTLFLRGCLEASKVDVKFCADVPANDETLAVATWAAQRCMSQGFTDSYCHHVMRQIPEYCSSPKRTSKL